MSLPSSFFKSIPIPSFFSLHSHSPYAGDQSHLFMIYSSYVFFFFSEMSRSMQILFLFFRTQKKKYFIHSCILFLSLKNVSWKSLYICSQRSSPPFYTLFSVVPLCGQTLFNCSPGYQHLFLRFCNYLQMLQLIPLCVCIFILLQVVTVG